VHARTPDIRHANDPGNYDGLKVNCISQERGQKEGRRAKERDTAAVAYRELSIKGDHPSDSRVSRQGHTVRSLDHLDSHRPRHPVEDAQFRVSFPISRSALLAAAQIL